MGARQPLAVLGGEPCFREPVFITRSNLPDEAVFHELTASVFRARWFTNDGALVRQLEERLRLRLGVGLCMTFCNGTMALQAALRALHLSGEVITTPFTFPATVHALAWLGLQPVFCDVDPNTYNLDVTHAADLVTGETSALLPVHVFGNPCDVVGVEQLAAQKGLRVVYDAAHAFAVEHRGRSIGSWGDLSILSFHATKLFHTAEGGAVVAAAAEHFAALALLRNFGIVNEESVSGIGVNGKLSELHAALGLALFERIDDEIAARGRLKAHYLDRLADVAGLSFQRQQPDTVPNNAYFSIVVDEHEFGLSRDELCAALRRDNIVARKYFFPLCSDNVAYRDLPSARPERLPVAWRVAAQILCLPLYGDLGVDGVDLIADRLLAIQAAAPAVRAKLRAR